jgi:hypothetical protein
VPLRALGERLRPAFVRLASQQYDTREVNQMRSKVALIALALVIATPGLVTAKTKAVHRTHSYTATQAQPSCGQFKYRKGGKCEDARNKGKDWKAF